MNTNIPVIREQQQETEIVQTNQEAIASFERIQIDTQISTAKKYPRNVEEIVKRCANTLYENPDIAEKCFYVLKRWDKKENKEIAVEGASVRLAEIIAQEWGNIRLQCFISEINPKYVRAIANGIDLEKNFAISKECMRPILMRGQDAVSITSAAAMAIATRNVISSLIPKGYLNKLLKIAKDSAVKQTAKIPIEEKRKMWIEWANSIGVSKEQLFRWLKINSENEMTIEHFKELRGLQNAIEDGETTIENEFGNLQEMENQNKNENIKAFETPEKSGVQEQSAISQKTIYETVIEEYAKENISEEQLIEFAKKYSMIKGNQRLQDLPENILQKFLKQKSGWIKIIKQN